MCGIVGIHGRQEDAWIANMNQIQTHRGPDDAGIFRDESMKLSLAVRRLAILDIEHGHQPMTSKDGRYTIVFNGEIFNAPELRAQLEKKGVAFMTDHSDTEVLLSLYALEGEDMVKKLNGMFAFAVYDKKQATLFCARDHMGIKPFFYTASPAHFAFASELKSLLTLPFLKRELELKSFFHYMSLMYVPGEDTIFKNIRRLPAGHTLTYQLREKKVAVRRFWAPTFGGGGDYSEREWSERIRETLGQAVSRWTLSDVPLACSLSGGLDSSSIVGLLAQSGQKVKTYSLGFAGKGEEEWSELALARKVAERWGTEHHELVLKPESLQDDLLEMVWHLDEPYGGGLPSWMVFRHMAKDVKVGLTGTGGDELFGNYGKWRFLDRAMFPSFRKHFFERFYYFSDDAKRNIIMQSSACQDTSEFLAGYAASSSANNSRDRIAALDLATQLPEEFLMMTDRFSMAHSLEARTPFLDRELVSLVLSIPAKTRTKRDDVKYLLRAAVSDVLPPELRNAPKKGFVLPLTLWLRGPLKPLVLWALGAQRLKQQGLFAPTFFESYVQPHLDSRADHTQKIWAALMFQMWHHLFLERKTLEKPAYTWKTLIS